MEVGTIGSHPSALPYMKVTQDLERGRGEGRRGEGEILKSKTTSRL